MYRTLKSDKIKAIKLKHRKNHYCGQLIMPNNLLPVQFYFGGKTLFLKSPNIFPAGR